MTIHGSERAVDRNLSDDDIDFIVSYGHRERHTGVIYCQLRTRELSIHFPHEPEYERLVGATVILCSCGRTVITVYRNEAAFRKDRRKAAYDHKKHTCALCDQPLDVATAA